MKGKKILIGISGSIAAYKIPILVRLLIKQGAEVKIIMTTTATQFVSPLVLGTLSKNPVLVDMTADNTWSNHVMLGRWADIMLIAPASCNTIAKMSNGLCDNLLLAVYLSATCPVFIAPAMDEDMWHHPSLQQNLTRLATYGNQLIQAEFGELASGLTGMGRMAEPETIIENLENFFNDKNALAGKTAIVTAGPTYENLDPVRFIGNYSTGKMGIAIAETLASMGCKVNLILGPTSLSAHHTGISTHRVVSAEQMFQTAVSLFPNQDIAVMAAAVADYTPVNISSEKIKKKDDTFELQLTKTKDILKFLGGIKKNHQVLVGFALENHDEKTYALNKLKEKNADFVVLNSLRDSGAGFATDTNKISIFEQNGTETAYSLKSKTEVASDIVVKIIEGLRLKNNL